ANPSGKCQELLSKVQPMRHELVIYRGKDRVWEGPVSLTSEEAGSYSLRARDVLLYAYRTAMEFEHNSAATGAQPVVDRAVEILTEEFNRVKETLNPAYNVVPHITAIRYPDISLERRTRRHTLPYQLLVTDDLEEMARTGGLDYTAVGRRIILNDTRVPVGTTPRVSEADFIGPVIVASYGMDSATQAITTGDNGMFGTYGGVDDYYGEIQILDSMFDA